MINYDTLNVGLFIAILCPALAEIRDTTKLWSLKYKDIYFILFLGSFGKVSVTVIFYLCIS